MRAAPGGRAEVGDRQLGFGHPKAMPRRPGRRGVRSARLLHADGDADRTLPMRGTAKKVVGATADFSVTVSTLSAKLAMAPDRSGRKAVKVRFARWQSGQ